VKSRLSWPSWRGAAAHEINQPYQRESATQSCSSVSSASMSNSFTAANVIVTESERMAEIVPQSRQDHQYETKSYVGARRSWTREGDRKGRRGSAAMSTDSEELGETPGPPEAGASEPVRSGRRRSSESPLEQSWRDV